MLYIIRGLPGSGKSSLAFKLGVAFFECDMYAMHNGKYEFDYKQLNKAVEWTFDSTIHALNCGMDAATVGTFTIVNHFMPYIRYCRENKIPYKVIHCMSDFGNIHSVPEDVLEKMRNQMEDYDDEIEYYDDIEKLKEVLWK